MTIAHVDCQAGASGNMVLGALLDAGLDKDRLLAELRKLRLPPWDMRDERVRRGAIDARLVDFEISGSGGQHAFADIDGMLAQADLDRGVRADARALWRRLAEAEAQAHGVAVQDVHFHEVGAADSVLDVVGALAGFRLLRLARVSVSPINTGSGTVQSAHGPLPVPAPATLRVLAGSGAVVYGSDIDFELLTPTGAAVLTHAASAYGPMPAMRVTRSGYGAGTADLSIPNVLRVTLGEPAETPDAASAPAPDADDAVVLDTNIDDMNPEIFGYVSARLFQAGAWDVWTTPIGMKAGRPAVQLSALAEPARAPALVDVILAETTTLGVRAHDVRRSRLPRAVVGVSTRYGQVQVKASYFRGALRDVAPEARDCQRLAAAHGVPWREVYDAARAGGRAHAPPAPAAPEASDPCP